MLLGVRPTKELKEYLNVLRRELIYGKFREIEITDLAMFDISSKWFRDVNISWFVMEQHINGILAGNERAMQEEEYRTREQALYGEAAKVGLRFTRDPIHLRFRVSLASAPQP